jgi:sigma-B regulation protein RsbU (phosphoserine phosphatase)
MSPGIRFSRFRVSPVTSALIILIAGQALLFIAALCFLHLQRRHIRRVEVENLRLQKDRKSVVDFMHGLSMTLDDRVSRGRMMDRILGAALESTGATSACLYEGTHNKQLRMAAVEGLFPPLAPIPEGQKESLLTRSRFVERVLRSEEITLGQGLVGEVARSGRAELIPNAAEDPRLPNREDASLLPSSLILAPMVFNKHCFGVLALANPDHGGAFSKTDFEIALWIAEQAALALHNSDYLSLHSERQQLDQDLALASSIQKMILPGSAPQVPGFDIDLRYAPAQKVGGDLYDIVELEGERLGVAIADVSGKGIPASLLMASCRSHLRQIAPRFGSPAKVLSELNRSMQSDMQPCMFVTVSYAIIDPASGEFTYARAGHELPLLVKARPEPGREVDFLHSEGMPVGLVPPEIFDEGIEDRQGRLDPGDVLVLYTDGITEAPNPEDREYSGARLADVVLGQSHASACRINDEVLQSLETFVRARDQRDDYTLVTVKRL